MVWMVLPDHQVELIYIVKLTADHYELNSGVPGTQGQPGQDGIPGKDGKDGSPGPPGPPGCNLISIANEFYAHIKIRYFYDSGTPGQYGTDGTPGKDGQEGQNGKPGFDGKFGQDGQNGQSGQDGQDGKDGQNGQNGKNGQDGSGPTGRNLKFSEYSFESSMSSLYSFFFIVRKSRKISNQSFVFLYNHEPLGGRNIMMPSGKDGYRENQWYIDPKSDEDDFDWFTVSAIVLKPLTDESDESPVPFDDNDLKAILMDQDSLGVPKSDFVKEFSPYSGKWLSSLMVGSLRH